jgi:hypothetical protein
MIFCQELERNRLGARNDGARYQNIKGKTKGGTQFERIKDAPCT